MGVDYSSCSLSLSFPSTNTFTTHTKTTTTDFSYRSKSSCCCFPFNPTTTKSLQTHLQKSSKIIMAQSDMPLKCCSTRVDDELETQQENSAKPNFDPHEIDPELINKIAYDALVWSSLHGLVVGDRNSQRSATVPGVGMVHAPVALLPTLFPESQWKQACEVAPIFNELIDRVSLDGNFLQESLSRTKKVDAFTSRLLDIHSKMLEINKKEEIRLGLHRSDYMLDEQTKLLLQIELNTISSSFAGLSSVVSELHRPAGEGGRGYLLFDGSISYILSTGGAWRPPPFGFLYKFR